MSRLYDESNRRLYQNKRSTQFLVSEIRKLAGLLGKKKGQGLRSSSLPVD